MSGHPYLVLVALYTFASYFAMHQSSHIAYLRVDPRVKLNSILSFLMLIEKIAGLIFLFWYGYMTVWYYPIILGAIGLATTFILKAVEHAMGLHRRAWAISISGIFLIPPLLYLMVLQVNNMAE